MIPQRIVLRGFLSYREEQEISLDGASLWLLAGQNGSGKSAVAQTGVSCLEGVNSTTGVPFQIAIPVKSPKDIAEMLRSEVAKVQIGIVSELCQMTP